MKKHFLVIWSVDIYEDTPEKAAKTALEIMQDKNSTATVFSVEDVKTGVSHRVDIAQHKPLD